VKISHTLDTLLGEMEEYSRTHDAVYAVPREEGIFLNMLVRLQKPKRILELGTSSGYSTIWLALAAAHNGGRIETVEFDPAKVKLAAYNIGRAGLTDVITIHQADANEFLATMRDQVDFVFMDTEKGEYLRQFKLLFPRLAGGGLVAADNAVDLAENMQDYLEYVKSHPGLQSVTVPVGNGLELTYRL
jgi:caffeoyl-CoA O-methyltransferase